MGDKFKDKELVKVRTRKRPSGRRVVYLEYCVNGKQKQEYLKLFLEPEERTDRKAASHNKEVMKLVNNIKAKRTMELLESMTGMSIDKGNGKMLFSDWVEQYKKEKERVFRGKSSIKSINCITRHLFLYYGKDFRMQDINKEFCLGFMDYLKTAKKNGKPFTKVTQYTYYRVFNTLLRQAVLAGILPKNPISMLQNFEKVKAASGERVYLDISEVKKLAITECKNDLVKRAFMFCCFCGLRFSDMEKLKWDDIAAVTDEDGNKCYHLSTIMQKTQKKVDFMLSNEAMKWLPEKKDSPFVFDGLISNTNGNIVLKKWAEAAGITKYVSFHVARHTFATMMLTLGADLYTTSKLLGHSNIATTQIYAKIVDKKKDEAMGLIDKFFG